MWTEEREPLMQHNSISAGAEKNNTNSGNVLTKLGLISGSPRWLKMLWISGEAMGQSFLKNLYQWDCPGNVVDYTDPL